MDNGYILYMIAHYINQEEKTFCICLKTARSKRAYLYTCIKTCKVHLL